MPTPFDWIDIPVGSVTLIPNENYQHESYLKTETTFEVPAFTIAKYPVTNAQFSLFIDAGGYHQHRWWTDPGWQHRQAKHKTQPLYWHLPEWTHPEQPVVGVTWYEAIAFCHWLSEAAGEHITLPTDQQWQRAAQGDDSRAYPWGNEWDSDRCNHNVDHNGVQITTSVRQYEGRGDSPFGVVEMTGNVAAWCLTDDENGTNDVNSPASYRVVRGASWAEEHPLLFRCDHRIRIPPSMTAFNVIGFRCVRLA